MALYQNTSTISDYSLVLNTPYAIYPNKRPTCSKDTSTQISFTALRDIWVCFDSFYTLTCNQIWELTIECGSFLEVHRPFDPEVLVAVNLGDTTWVTDSSGNKLANVPITGLCAGTYHLWFVYKSRIGKIIKGIRTIYITYPSCTC